MDALLSLKLSRRSVAPHYRAFFALAVLFLAAQSRAQSPPELHPTPLIVPAQYSAIFDSSRTVWLPKGFECQVFYTERNWAPRFMAFDDYGVLAVADAQNSRVLSFPDNDSDGVADTALVIATGDSNAHSIAFRPAELLVASSNTVFSYYQQFVGGYGFQHVVDSNIGDAPEGAPNHTTRTILLDPTNNNYIFLSNGAPCNACRERDMNRAAIHRYPATNLTNGVSETIATGLRNAVGLAIDPVTGDLWASCAERNNLGADEPREFVTRIERQGFYGWPLAYTDANGEIKWDDFSATPEYQALLPITAEDSLRVQGMKTPNLTLEAHSTPLGIAFEQGSNFPDSLRHDLFVALHGSYPSTDGRVIANGSRIVRAHLEQDGTRTLHDFASGFLTDSVHYKRWARPCGILFGPNGDLFFTSDHTAEHSGPAIFRIRFVGTNRVDPMNNAHAEELRITTDRNGNSVRIELPDARPTHITVTDELGRNFITTTVDRSVTLNTHDSSSGVYYVADGNRTQRFLLLR